MLKKKKPDDGSKKVSVSEEVNTLFNYVYKQMQNKNSKKDEQDATRQRELNNFETVEDSDDELERQLVGLEEAG